MLYHFSPQFGYIYSLIDRLEVHDLLGDNEYWGLGPLHYVSTQQNKTDKLPVIIYILKHHTNTDSVPNSH